MIRKAETKRGSMWCRMLISRAWETTGAFDLFAARLRGTVR